MSTVPFKPLATINTTQVIANVKPKDVWPIVKAMNEWDTFQDLFSVELVEQDDDANKKKNNKSNNNTNQAIVEVGQLIEITSDFPVIPQVTLEEYNEIIEEERICWTLRGFILLDLVTLPSPPGVLRTARCIELFDDGDGGTILHNWISYAGLAWPLIVLTTGGLTENLFMDFNAELANQF